MTVILHRCAAYVLAGSGLGVAAWLWLLGHLVMAVALGALACGLGGLLLRRARVRMPVVAAPPGMDGCRFRITPTAALFAMDAIAVLAAAIAGFFVVDGFGPRLAGVAPLLTDPLAADVIAVMLLPAAFVLAGFISAAGGQTVTMGPTGIALTGPFGSEAARWEEIRALTWRDEHVIVSRLGLPMPRRLRTNLDLHLGNGRCMTILEPATPATRGMLQRGLESYAPRRLTDPLGLPPAL